MRSASSYRGAKKQAAREAGVSFHKFNDHFKRSRHFALAELERMALTSTPAQAQIALAVLGSPETPADARRKLGLWARSGGRKTVVSPQIEQAELDEMNKALPVDEETVAKKLTLADIDKALEQALTNWQAGGHATPLELSKPFAARARQIGWVEEVEFVEAKTR